ncbi:MAG: Spo0B domain-containing protein [Sulfobacillus thermotolerans]|nr:Spo0B domain-containing protein [Sulfobacillus thermotolerans]
MKRNALTKRASRLSAVVLRLAIFIALGVGSYLSPHFWRVVFLLLFAAYTASTVRVADQAQAVEMIRRYRHRYANHLQIISGWLELEKVSRAERYLADHAMSSVQPGVFQGLPLRWVYKMMALEALAEASGAEIRWVQAHKSGGSYWMLWKLSAVLRSIIPYAQGVITVTFFRRGFHVETEGMKHLSHKHIRGVFWRHHDNRLDVMWGVRK